MVSIVLLCLFMLFEVVLELRFFAPSTPVANTAAFDRERDSATIAYLRASVHALMVENENLKTTLANSPAITSAPAPVVVNDATSPTTITPVLEANPEDFVIVVMTAFNSKSMFPERARDLQTAWGSGFPRLLFVGVDLPDARERLINEFGCSLREVRALDDAAAPPHAEYTCFEANARLKVVLLPGCDDDRHSPVGTSCKAQNGLLHVAKYEPTWLESAKWFAVSDDDVFIWRSEFLRWAARIPHDPATTEIAITPFGWSMHSICKPINNVERAPPVIPVTSIFGMISKPLLLRHLPFLINNTLVSLAQEWDQLHDITWGLLLHNTRPWKSVTIPWCDDRQPAGCSNRVVLVHAVRVESETMRTGYCRPSGDQRLYHSLFDDSFAHGAVPDPYWQDAPPIAKELWSKSQCAEFLAEQQKLQQQQ